MEGIEFCERTWFSHQAIIWQIPWTGKIVVVFVILIINAAETVQCVEVLFQSVPSSICKKPSWLDGSCTSSNFLKIKCVPGFLTINIFSY